MYLKVYYYLYVPTYTLCVPLTNTLLALILFQQEEPERRKKKYLCPKQIKHLETSLLFCFYRNTAKFKGYIIIFT